MENNLVLGDVKDDLRMEKVHEEKMRNNYISKKMSPRDDFGKPKILIVPHYFLPHTGGIEFVAYNQAKELVKQGHDVTIVGSKIGNELEEEEVMEEIKIKRSRVWNFFEENYGILGGGIFARERFN